jgi:hypothetical protein
LQAGVLLLDCAIELGVTAVIGTRAVELIFIADFNVLQRERGWVAVLYALCAPLGVRAAGYVFDLVESILNVGLKCRTRIDVL